MSTWFSHSDQPRSTSKLADCATCIGPHTNGEPNGVDCRCGRHFHFSDDLWIRDDKCVVCPSCGRALSPWDFDVNGVERDSGASVSMKAKERIGLPGSAIDAIQAIRAALRGES